MKPKRKKISKLAWGVKWGDGKINVYHTKKNALELMSFYGRDTRSFLFRCKIEEVTK